MAYKSEAQARKIRKLHRDGKISDEDLSKWEEGTKWDKLPERVNPKRRERKSRPRTTPTRESRKRNKRESRYRRQT